MSRDERSFAVVAAEAGAGEWRAAVVAQRSAVLDHGDFYALGGELVETLRALEALAGVLGLQVAGYGAERRLYDDAGGDPAARLAEAGTWLDALREQLRTAERRAQGFWSAIGHIGLALDGGVADDVTDRSDGVDR